MALLDLQVLEVARAPGEKRPKGSRASKSCMAGPGGPESALSIFLCSPCT